jgi:hypothetical protein
VFDGSLLAIKRSQPPYPENAATKMRLSRRVIKEQA